jgi:hypothetical protein
VEPGSRQAKAMSIPAAGTFFGYALRPRFKPIQSHWDQAQNLGPAQGRRIQTVSQRAARDRGADTHPPALRNAGIVSERQPEYLDGVQFSRPSVKGDTK